MTKQSAPISFRDSGVEANIDMRTLPGESRNLTAKECLDRYFKILSAEAGQTSLMAEEWVALKRATVSRYFQADRPPMLGMSLYDAFQAGDLGEDWDESAVLKLMNKLEALRPAQQWSIVDTLERWRVTGD